MKQITLVDRWVKLKEFPNPVYIRIYLKEFDSYGILYSRFKSFRLFGKTVTITNPFSIGCACLYRATVYKQAMEGEKQGKLITDVNKGKIFQIS